MYKLITISLLVAFHCFAVTGQTKQLTLEDCYERAKQNYPLIKQRDLISKTRDYSVDNAAKGYLPQINIVGQATYQSTVVEFPKPLQGTIYPTFSKDLYKVGAELTQTIYDGGAIKYTKETQVANAALQEQTLEVNLYAVRERVNQLFFGILLIGRQIELTELKKNDIQNALHKTQGAYNNGTALKSSVDELKAELINADQSKIELQANRKAYANMLTILINLPVTEDIQLVKPGDQTLSSNINRPELQQYDYQKKLFDIQESQIQIAHLPKVSAFAQGYYGRPTYNFISNDFGWYGIIGVRFNWTITSFYTNKNDKQLINVNRANVDVQRETFLFNTQLSLSQQSEDVSKYKQLLQQDQEVIDLRGAIKTAANAQLDNGVITTHDFIVKVNDESQAKLNAALHEIQMLQAEYTYKNTAGN
jgi:outer membrane protein TolC